MSRTILKKLFRILYIFDLIPVMRFYSTLPIECVGPLYQSKFLFHLILSTRTGSKLYL